ncbi:subtilisin-like protease SBT1.4 [Phragmites australis]|uniref:subtilisin-like protease SBT1.4 n=1 Tax=Phragmites australis TaxID=29695 RepID=UPI002D7A0DB4|nr:subtilisin-like protease SBT1.4 [Phragmites australis]
MTPMGKQLAVILACFLLLAVATATTPTDLKQDAVSTYIVHVAPAGATRSSSHRAPGNLARAYASMVRDLLPARISRPAPRLLYSYAHAATGFAARLTARQASHLEAQPSIAAVVRDTLHEVHTTLSSSFLHLTPSSGLQEASNGAADAVIAVLDMGIYPKDRASFAADPSLPPPPPSFRGGCISTREFNATIYCNNKLVGAKIFYEGYEAGIGHPIDETEESKSPLDTDGHGTHTASTAAGAPVPNADLFGFASGTAKGTAPGARIAVYKVCWKLGCAGSDILAGMDEAIADGVDVISLSLGSPQKTLVADPVAVGGFGAIRKGIIISASSSNSGPKKFTIANSAPWVITVGASTMNRQFPAVVVLGDGQSFVGTSLYPGDPNGTLTSLIYGGDAGSATCEVGKLDHRKVAGKIVFCDAGVVSDAKKGVAVDQAGGLGAIISSSKARGEFAKSTPYLIPTAAVPYVDAVEISRYISTTPNPVAKILFFGTVIGTPPSAPRVASFSGRGPNTPAPEILKPDLVAPGVDILAAWSGVVSPSKTDVDTRRVEFNILSGTSMSCPHVSGIAALLKMARPSWSPAMIKSAMMTTAYNEDSAGETIKDMATGKAAGPFELGAGHVDPNRALDPGLVYDAGEEDYRSFLCSLGYSERTIDGVFVRDGSVTDCSTLPSSAVGDLNLPSFSVVFKAYGDKKATLRRVARNVGAEVDAVYTVDVVAPPGTQVTVTPSKLVFDAEHKTREYTITILSASTGDFGEYTHGSILWTDGVHEVRSPIAVTWPSWSAAMSVM